MYLPAISRHIGKLIVAAGLTLGGTPLAFAAHPDMAGTHHPGMTGTHKSYSRIPDGCQFAAHDGTQQPADYLQSFATGLGLSGQQRQDLQILAMDYGERLRDLAKLMGDIGKKLAMTEPDDPGYWPIAQEVSASAAASTAETVILLSEMRVKFHQVLTPGQRAQLKSRLEELAARCRPPVKTEPSAE
jgi:Spy/CpxP family protein refolding chaperone